MAKQIKELDSIQIQKELNKLFNIQDEVQQKRVKEVQQQENKELIRAILYMCIGITMTLSAVAILYYCF